MASMYTSAIIIMVTANLLYIRGQVESSSSGIGQPMFSESDVLVNITSSKLNPIRPVETEVMLNCTLDLSPAVILPTALQILWIGPDGNIINNINEPDIERKILTGTALIRSFGREQAGYYTCLATATFTVPVTQYFNDVSINMSDSVLITTGTYITFNGRELANNSAIDISSIRDFDCNELQSTDPVGVSGYLVCHTDRPDCCKKNIEGEWYFHNEGNNGSDGFCVIQSDQGTVILTRNKDNLFSSFIVLCCNIPDISGVNQTLCVNYDPHISHSGADPIAGENYSLTCNTTREGVMNYLWKKDSMTLDETGPTLSFSPLRLSDAGLYSCNTVQSEIILKIPGPESISLSSNKPNPIWPNGSDVTLTCIVELSPVSDRSLLLVDAQLTRDRTPLTLTDPTVTGTTFTYTYKLESFGSNGSGNYTCTATIRRQPNASYLTGMFSNKSSIMLSTGVYLSLNRQLIANNSQIHISTIGEGDTVALLCMTDLHNFNNNDHYNNIMEVGKWYFPNKSAVKTSGDIYINRGHGVVHLHRKKNITMPNGMFRCEIPDANRTIQNIYVDIYYQFETSTSRPSSPNMAAIAGAVVSGLLLIAAGIVTITIIICRLRDQWKKTDHVIVTTEIVKFTTSTNLSLKPEIQPGVPNEMPLQIPPEMPAEMTLQILPTEKSVIQVEMTAEMPSETLPDTLLDIPPEKPPERPLENSSEVSPETPSEAPHEAPYEAPHEMPHSLEMYEMIPEKDRGEFIRLNKYLDGSGDEEDMESYKESSTTADGYVRPIPVSEFSSHVERLHADRDKQFEFEYTVN